MIFFQASNTILPNWLAPTPPGHGICIHFLPPKYLPHRIRCWSWHPPIELDIQWISLCGKNATQKVLEVTNYTITTTRQAFEEACISASQTRWKTYGRLDTQEVGHPKARCGVVCDPPSWAVKKTSVSTKDKQHIQHIQRIQEV